VTALEPRLPGMIAEGTNPWVEVDGEPVYWPAVDLPRIPCPCGAGFEVIEPGVLESMDSPRGVQRCDACSTYDGDIEAAVALARRVGGVVRFVAEVDPEGVSDVGAGDPDA
jgi:hypothetical protein